MHSFTRAWRAVCVGFMEMLKGSMQLLQTFAMCNQPFLMRAGVNFSRLGFFDGNFQPFDLAGYTTCCMEVGQFEVACVSDANEMAD